MILLNPSVNPCIFWKFNQEQSTYDAVDKDFAHVNIFFGQNHCMGEFETIKATEKNSPVQSNQ